jgi:signal transduction histidine kinase
LEDETEARVLGALDALVGQSIPFDEVMTSLMRTTSALMRADGSSVLLVHSKGDDVDFFTYLGEEAEQAGGVFRDNLEKIFRCLAETEHEWVVSDITREPRLSQRVHQLGDFRLRSLACAPLRVRKEFRGVIGVMSAGIGKFDDRDLETLTRVAPQLAMMIDNARLIHEIKPLCNRLAEMNRQRTEFLATVIHELRTPVSIVIGDLDVLLGGFLGELNSRQIASLQTALRNSWETLNLISSLLDLSRIQAGQLVVRAEEFRLEDLWNEVEMMFRIGLSGKEIDLIWEMKSPLPPLMTDKIKVKGILSNIVFNAIKFTDRGRIQVCASLVDEGNAVEIKIQDTGVGIPSELIPVIFEPFLQAEASVARSQGGAGLGLNIAKKLVDLLHGRIEVESNPGEGSTFRITIPAKYSS